MADVKLPPMPKPEKFGEYYDGSDITGFDADHMEAYAIEAIRLNAQPVDAQAQSRVPLATEVVQAVARGWCHPKNSHKVMDSDLALAIAAEVNAMLAASPQPQPVQPSEPAFWAPPERDGTYHSFDTETVYRTPKAGWAPLYRAPVAQAKPEQAGHPEQDPAMVAQPERVPMTTAQRRHIIQSANAIGQAIDMVERHHNIITKKE